MFRRFARLYPYMKRNRAMLALGAAALVLANYFDIRVLVLLGEGIDALRIRLGEASQAGVRPLRTVLTLTVAFALIGAVARFLMRRLIIGVSRHIEFALRNDLFSHLETLSASFYHRYRTGDIMARATNDMEAVRMLIGPAIMYLASTAVMLPMCLWAMIRISGLLTLITWMPLLLIAPLFYFFSRRIHARFTRVQEAFSEISSRVQEHLAGIRVVKAYAREDQEAKRFDRLSLQYVEQNIRLTRLQAFFIPLMGLMVGLSLLALVSAGSLMIVRGGSHGLTPGTMISFFLLLLANIWPMAAIGWVFSVVERGAASLERLEELFREQPEVVDAPSAVILPKLAGSGRIQVVNLTFTYPGGDRPALVDISFDLRAGQTLGLTGPVGCGKSTLAMLLARRYNPERGRILVDGVDLLDWPLKDYRGQVAIVDQEPFIFSETIRENIGYGLSDEADGTLERATVIAQLREDLRSFPQGLDTMLGERGINLSGGQCQRAALARALATDPQLLILDDALSAVDTHTEEEILIRLQKFMQGRTTLLISHRIRAVAIADHILYLENGRIVEEGTHEALIKSKGKYWRLSQKQQLVEEIEETA